MPNETETPEKEEETEKTPEEKAAELEAKIKRAEELEKENTELKAKLSKPTETRQTNPDGPYSLSSFSEEDWTSAETQYGTDRKSLLMLMNMRAQTKKETQAAVASLETKLLAQQDKESRAQDDPLYPKYRKEVDRFLSDIPPEFLSTEEGRKKWLDKAFEFGKRSLKTSTQQRSPANMDTKVKDDEDKVKSDKYTPEEEEVFASHGKKAEDYDKIKHPFIVDGIKLSDKPARAEFGPKK